MSKQIDPRGPRFGAAITTVVLAVILLTIPTSLATVLLGIQTVVFALGAFVRNHLPQVRFAANCKANSLRSS